MNEADDTINIKEFVGAVVNRVVYYCAKCGEAINIDEAEVRSWSMIQQGKHVTIWHTDEYNVLKKVKELVFKDSTIKPI